MDRYDMTWHDGPQMGLAKEGEYSRCEDIVAKLSPLHEKCEALDELGEDNINEMSIGQLQRTLKKYDKLLTGVYDDLEVLLGELI